MKVLSKLNSLDNINDGDTRKLITKTQESGEGNAVSSISVSGDTITYTKGLNAITSHQKTFSNVKIGETTIGADQAGDTLELVASGDVTLTPDTTNDKVTIAATKHEGIFYVSNIVGTAAKTSSPYCAALWYTSENDDRITSLYNGLTIVVEVPVAGNSSYGCLLNINGLGDHPVVWNINSQIGTRYGVGSTVLITYNETQTATAYYNTTASTTYTGVWQVCSDYSQADIYQIKTNNSKLTVNASAGSLYRYMLCMTNKNNELIPFNNTSNAVSTYTKAFNSQPFDPFGPIWYYATTTTVSAGGQPSASYMYNQHQINARYSMNLNSAGTAGTTSLTANKPVYLRVLYNKTTHLANFTQDVSSSSYLERSSIVQALPVTNPNVGLNENTCYLYILLGQAYSLYQIEIYYQHPIYYWDSVNSCMANIKSREGGSSGNYLEKSYTAPSGKMDITGQVKWENGEEGENPYYFLGMTNPTTETKSELFFNPDFITLQSVESQNSNNGVKLQFQNEWQNPSFDLLASYNGAESGISVTNGETFILGLTTPVREEDAATKKYVDDTVAALPEPMLFKGSLGTNGTITTLPTASSSNEGHVYKVITAGTYASQTAKIGDTFISDGTAWILIPSGDEPSGTVTSVTLNATSPIVIDNNAAITTSGTRTLSHANSGVSAGTYKSVTVDAKGHVTGGTNPTTLSGYGITDGLEKSYTDNTNTGNISWWDYDGDLGLDIKINNGNSGVIAANYGTYLYDGNFQVGVEDTQAWMSYEPPEEPSKGASNVRNKVLVNSNGTYITGLVTPTSNTDAANKKYVDDAIAAAITDALEASY